MKADNAGQKQIERHYQLLKMLCHEEGCFKQQLINALKVSERTIERDIRILSKWVEINDERVGREVRYFLHHCPFCDALLRESDGGDSED